MKIPSRVSRFTSLCFLFPLFLMLFRLSRLCFPTFVLLCFEGQNIFGLFVFLCIKRNHMKIIFYYTHLRFIIEVFPWKISTEKCSNRIKTKWLPFYLKRKLLMLIWAAELFHKDVPKELKWFWMNRRKKRSSEIQRKPTDASVDSAPWMKVIFVSTLIKSRGNDSNAGENSYLLKSRSSTENCKDIVEVIRVFLTALLSSATIYRKCFATCTVSAKKVRIWHNNLPRLPRLISSFVCSWFYSRDIFSRSWRS